MLHGGSLPRLLMVGERYHALQLSEPPNPIPAPRTMDWL